MGGINLQSVITVLEGAVEVSKPRPCVGAVAEGYAEGPVKLLEVIWIRVMGELVCGEGDEVGIGFN